MYLFQEKVKKVAWVCIAVSVLGLLLILISSLYSNQNVHSSMGGCISLMVAVLAMGFYSNIQRLLLERGFKPLEMTAWSIWFGTICMLFFFT